MADVDIVQLIDDQGGEPPEQGPRWKIAVIDDEPAVHDGTRFALADYRLNGQGLEILSAYSAAEGRELMRKHPDVAVVLLDVIMESDTAGLGLVEFIRKELKNETVRIILRTGQPGQAPEQAAGLAEAVRCDGAPGVEFRTYGTWIELRRCLEQLDRPETADLTVVLVLGEYFRGERTAFDLPLAPTGTAFQLRVWEQLRTIPYGVTCSYADIARAVGAGNGFRAVGLANGRNPISIIVPCHRVIGADGRLTGYGGGMDRKRFLLDLESGVLPLA